MLFIFCASLYTFLPLWILTMPLLAAAASGVGRRWWDTVFLGIAAVLSCYMFAQTCQGATWTLSVPWLSLQRNTWWMGLRVDVEVALLVALTTVVGLGTHVYAMGYFTGEHRRYGVLTGLFLGAMLWFWMADHLVGSLMAWELISWGSYAFVIFDYQAAKAASNGSRVWMINHVGSVLLLLGIVLLGQELGTLRLSDLVALSSEALQEDIGVSLALFSLVCGLCIKSVQWPWFSWLTAAMTAPSPASALLHSATLIGAGIHLLVVLSPLFGTLLLDMLVYLGAMTALMGAFSAFTQQHIKRVLAYSTIAHIGHIVMAVGMQMNSLALLHFAVHAFAKSCLFLLAGAMGIENTGASTRMRGIPRLLFIYVLASASLLGLPGFGGALSKEALLVGSWRWAEGRTLLGYSMAYIVPIASWASSFLSVIYLSRLGYLVFVAAPRVRQSESGYSVSMDWGMGFLVLGTLGYWYGPLVSSLEPRLGEVALPVDLLSTAWWASCLAWIGGSVAYAAWQQVGFPSLPRPWQLLLQGGAEQLPEAITKIGEALSRLVTQLEIFLTDTVLSSLVRSYWSVAKWATQLEALLNGIIRHELVHGYWSLAQRAVWLEQTKFSGFLQWLAQQPRHWARAYEEMHEDRWQQTLALMALGLGMLLLAIWGLA